MCEWLGVSTSGHYEWRDRPESATVLRRQLLVLLVKEAFDESDETYGHRRVYAQLVRCGEHCSPKLVRGLMREQGLVACQPRPWRHNLTTSDPCADPIPDLVCRDFTAEAPGQKMVGDITSLRNSATWDQGKEMAEHASFTVKTGIDVYFCDPHSSWQQGSNENTNGLLCQYFPKGTDLSGYTQAELDAVADEFNNRPRETHGWLKPTEVLNKFLVKAGGALNT